MRSYVFFIAAILFFAQNSCLLAQAKEVNETEIKAAFIKYLESPWSKRADLMTPSSWNDYVGDMLYAYKDAATALLIEYKIKNYQFPEMPANYKDVPKRDAILAASKIRQKLVLDLSTKLGKNLGEFLDKLDEQTNSSSTGIRLADVNLTANLTIATAECHFNGGSVSIPMRFRKVNGAWKFNGKNEVLFFNRQRKANE